MNDGSIRREIIMRTSRYSRSSTKLTRFSKWIQTMFITQDSRFKLGYKSITLVHLKVRRGKLCKSATTFSTLSHSSTNQVCLSDQLVLKRTLSSSQLFKTEEAKDKQVMLCRLIKNSMTLQVILSHMILFLFSFLTSS